MRRSVQVSLVKPKADETSEVDITFEGKTAIIGHYLDKMMSKIGTAVIGYVVVDTLRQIAVTKATQVKK